MLLQCPGSQHDQRQIRHTGQKVNAADHCRLEDDSQKKDRYGD